MRAQLCIHLCDQFSKAILLEPRFSWSLTLMWHFIVHQVHPCISSLILLFLTQVLLKTKYPSVMIWLDMYKEKPNQQQLKQSRISFLSHVNRKPRRQGWSGGSVDIRDPNCFSLSASSFSMGGFHPQGDLMIIYSCRSSSYHNLALGKRREKREKKKVLSVKWVTFI